MLGNQRFLVNIGDSGGVDIIQLHFQRGAQRVVCDKAPGRTGLDPPQIGFGQVAAQARALLHHFGQGQARRHPAARPQIAEQIAHDPGMRCAQLQPFTLGDKAAVLGNSLGQALLKDATVASGFAAPGLTTQLQLQNLDFAANDAQARIQVRGLQLHQQLILRHALAVMHPHLADTRRRRRMQRAAARCLEHRRCFDVTAPGHQQHRQQCQKPQP
ncbi:hypothetical protein D9M71_538850 [compost metagenome]